MKYYLSSIWTAVFTFRFHFSLCLVFEFYYHLNFIFEWQNSKCFHECVPMIYFYNVSETTKFNLCGFWHCRYNLWTRTYLICTRVGSKLQLLIILLLLLCNYYLRIMYVTFWKWEYEICKMNGIYEQKTTFLKIYVFVHVWYHT